MQHIGRLEREYDVREEVIEHIMESSAHRIRKGAANVLNSRSNEMGNSIVVKHANCSNGSC